MKNTYLRLFAAVLCMAVLMSGLPLDVCMPVVLAETSDGYSIETGNVELSDSALAAILGISEPIAEASSESIEEPANLPTAEPTEEPTAEPTEEPTAEPTEEPTPEPTEEPAVSPEATLPPENPEATPGESPVPTPAAEETVLPEETPAAEATLLPEATSLPAEVPTESPTVVPTQAPLAEDYIAPDSMAYPGEGVVLMRSGFSAVELSVYATCTETVFSADGRTTPEWTAHAQGYAPYLYQFNLYYRAPGEDGDFSLVARTMTDTADTFRVRIPMPGSYFLSVVATDASLAQAVWTSCVYQTEDEGAQTARIIGEWIAGMNAENFTREFDKALYLHDRLLQNSSADDSSTAARSVEAAIVQGRAGSIGYALAYEALLNAAGIDNCIIQSSADSRQAWNAVKLDGEWTHIDAFANESAPDDHSYFGLTDAVMARDHSWKSSAAPVCSGTKNNYFVHERGYTPYTSLVQLLELLVPDTELRLYAAEGDDINETVSTLALEMGYEVEIKSYGSCAEVRLFLPPVEIIPAQDHYTIGVGQKISVANWTLNREDPSVTVTYTSDDKKVAAVDENGVVSGVKTGTAYITLRTNEGVACDIEITVRKAPSSIKLTAPRSTVGVGESMQLSYTLSSGSAASVSYSSDDESVATVDANGVITAVGPGKCKITAKTHNSKKSSGTLTVKAAPQTISLAGELNLGVGQVQKLGYALNEGAAGAVRFSIANTAVAEIHPETGEITAKSIGSCIVIAESYNGVNAKCLLNVLPAPEEIRIVAERSTMGRKETMQLSAVSEPGGSACIVSYKSSKTSVVAVDANGMLTAKATGSATITATSYNGKTASVKITVKKEPSSIKLSAERSILGVGESMQLSAEFNSGAAGGYSFASSNPAVASVDADGLLIAHAAGKAEITVKTFNGKKSSKTFEVFPAPESVSFGRDTLLVGNTDSISVRASVNKGSAGAIRYTSTNEKIAVIDPESGKLTAMAVGTCGIVAESYNGKTALLIVEVIAAPESIRILAPRTTMGRKETMQLSVEAQPEGCACSVSYKSSKTSVVTVDENGLLTAKKTGSATITATSYNGKTATLKITVKKEPSSVKLSGESKTLGVGETALVKATLSSGSAGGYSFASSDPAVLSVSENGLLTANQIGTAKITVQTFNGKKSSAELTVCPAPQQVSIAGGDIRMGEGGSLTVAASLNSGAAGAIRFETADSDIAEVDPITGKIIAKSAGVTTLTATAYNGVSDAVALEVVPAPTYIKFASATLYIGVGDSIQLTPEMDEGSEATLRFATSRSKYASVSSSGLVKGVKAGDATITVKTHNGLSDTIKVVVQKAPSSVKFAEKEITLGVDEKYALNVSWTSGASTSLRFECEDETIATVNSEGVVTAQGLGFAAIRVTTHNGKTAYCTVNVMEAPEYVFRADGMLRAVKPGSATVRVDTYLPEVYAEAQVEVYPAPEEIRFDETSLVVDIDETLQLKPQLLPKGAFGSLEYTLEKEGFFTIDAHGRVTPLKKGSTRVKVSAYNGVYAIISIEVIDPNLPEKIELGETPSYLNEDEKFKIQYKVYPESANADMVWKSSDTDIASVSGETVRAKSYGRVTITGTSQSNPELSVSFSLTILSDERCLVMPERRTGTSSISANLRKISNVENSAYRELDALFAQGVINQSDYNKRKSIISKAFEMYAFPWMTKEFQPYWKEANSEDGAKDFKPGIVYYGLPYINTPWANRLYNIDKAVKEGRYYDSGNGYYLLDRSKLLNNMYVGNDCSSFVSMAIWGMSGANYNDTTNTIATAKVYTTIEDYKDMRPGDLLNWKGNHVVMFLYYANASKTQMVIVEQGGSEPAISTINCSVKRVSDYAENYVVRRLTSLVY